MVFYRLTSLLSALLAFSVTVSALAQQDENPWAEVERPSSQQSASIGSYTNGCLAGAEQMPIRGEGFQLVRTGRNRHFGHPDTIRFLEEFSRRVARNDLGRIQIGDMSMPRGGPFNSGHRSHQQGLDIDIWFSQDWRADKRPLTEWERDNISPKPLADEQEHRLLEENWDPRVPKILRIASEDDRVARIFVHPTIKRKMCELAGDDNEWLRKVRPWWGHNYHFHVRLACPEGDAYCKPQRPPSGDPCGPDLDWWFSNEFYAMLRGETPAPERPEPKPLPLQCKQVLIAP
ncbi:Penicillin-insensitive murein endopeptidase precursor [Microbulbifer aggregans]|uniref:Penicillin-insensitive murein endopeptidase n=1 Tax=Microbulbifer aggregans TaxID=1769779 RepID=A0A1C9W3P1_9GAMM|nr:penicillin-insensitive murein endopeptidase [Microbulbifer aggregans]AOS95765.1 Penicillin-insensitive murein endopeptidase precursor [Microbulbifer aggregans]